MNKIDIDYNCHALHGIKIPYKKGFKNNTDAYMKIGKAYLRKNRAEIVRDINEEYLGDNILLHDQSNGYELVIKYEYIEE